MVGGGGGGGGRRRLVGSVVLLRLGRYLVAVFEGERLLVSKTVVGAPRRRHLPGYGGQRTREGQMRQAGTTKLAG